MTQRSEKIAPAERAAVLDHMSTAKINAAGYFAIAV
jgi:hypothetical protein